MFIERHFTTERRLDLHRETLRGDGETLDTRCLQDVLRDTYDSTSRLRDTSDSPLTHTSDSHTSDSPHTRCSLRGTSTLRDTSHSPHTRCSLRDTSDSPHTRCSLRETSTLRHSPDSPHTMFIKVLLRDTSTLTSAFTSHTML